MRILIFFFFDGCISFQIFIIDVLLGSDWVDPDDPTVIAENELLGAANSIDAAAKKLASLRPRRSIQVNSFVYFINSKN